MDIPILSIDYSLAPEAPFPRAFEDIFYTYCWILKNVELVGSTGENIVFAGDSAGGNLNTACVLKAIEMGIKLPRGLFNAYTPFLVNFASTPARFLSLVDPLLPYGFIMRVFKSYGAVKLSTDETLSSHQSAVAKTKKDEKVEDVRDDNQDNSGVVSPVGDKTLETMWQKIKTSTEEPDWHTNLGPIRETPSEEPASPFDFSKGNPLSRQSSMMDSDEVKPRDRTTSRTLSEENIVTDVVSVQTFSETIQKATSSIFNAVTVPFKQVSPDRPNELHLEIAKNEKCDNSGIPKAPEGEFVFSVPVNHYLSPYWAPDDELKKFPPTRILTTIVDPCIDDCVEFSKKLKRLNVDVGLDVLSGLNHGFLNFAQVTIN